MPLWGKTAAGATNKPKWLPEDENSDYNKATVYADTSGWVVAPGTANSGSDNVNAQPEVLACIGGLSTTLAAPTVTKIRIVQSTIAAGSKTITAEVTWDEKVTVAGSPQVVIANGNQGTGSGRGPHTLTYTATGSTANRKRFTVASQTVAENDVLTLGGANITLNSGTITDTADGSTAASLVLSGETAVTLTVTA